MKENRRSFLKALGIFIPASSLIAKSYGDGIESKVEWDVDDEETSSFTDQEVMNFRRSSNGAMECDPEMPLLWQHTPDRKV